MPHSTHSTRSTSTTSTTTSRSRSSTPDAIKLLTTDHKEVKQLFKAYDKLAKNEASGDERRSAAQQICDMLTVHSTIEEEIFYPQARQVMDMQDLLDEAEVEHASAKDLIEQIRGMSPDEDLYDAKVKVLGEYVAHHIQEEENEIFPKVKKTVMDLEEVGASLKARKEALMGPAG